MNFSKSQIALSWSESSEAPSRDSVAWHPSDLSGRDDDFEADSKYDALLGAVGAVRALRIAFNKNYPRNLAWDVSLLNPSDASAVIAAARVYKRGVEILNGLNDSLRVSHISSNRSWINFYSDSGSLFEHLRADDAVFVDHSVFEHWWHTLPNHATPFGLTEHTKTLETAVDLDLRIPRSAKRLVVIGGGVLGDTAGFVAALRGLSTIYMPTTLLAMADSSVGGKTGVNFPPWGKNQVGVFHQPSSVLISPHWLQTLSLREIRSGLAECLKHAILSGNRPLWTELIQVAVTKKWQRLGSLLPDVVRVKADVVKRDPLERGERAVLNFGHTFGHALEALSLKLDGPAALTHGECVSIGMAYALKLSEKYFGFHDASDLLADLRRAELIRPLSKAVRANLFEAVRYMKTDKKNQSQGLVNWILFKDFGVIARGADESWTIPLRAEFHEDFIDEILLKVPQ